MNFMCPQHHNHRQANQCSHKTSDSELPQVQTTEVLPQQKTKTPKYCTFCQKSTVSIATCYRLDDPGLQSQWEGEIFQTHQDRGQGSTTLLYNGYRVSFPGVNEPRCGVDYPHSSGSEVE
jgi:hypothetical protein